MSKAAQLRKWVSQRLAILVAVGVASLAVVLWQALIAREQAQLKLAVEQEAFVLQSEIIERIEPKILALERMAMRWENRGGTPREEWEADAAQYIANQTGQRRITWVDPSYIARWTVPTQTSSYTGVNLGEEERRRVAMETARETREASVTGATNLFGDEQSILVFVPLIVSERFDGYIQGIFRIQELLGPMLFEQTALGYSFALFDGEEEIINGSEGDRQDQPEWLQENEVAIRSVTWRIQVWPRQELIAQMRSSLPEVVLAAGLLLAFLLTFTVRLARTARIQAQAVGLANQGLEEQITERKRTEEALREAHESLSVSLDQLEVRNREISQLSKMTDLLQSCYMMEEAYALITQFARELFPSASGGVYLLNHSRKVAESVAVWGKSPSSEDVFAVEACWAIRRGRAHFVQDGHSALLCDHLKEDPLAGYFCMPMMAGGEIIAILHLKNNADRSNPLEAPRKQPWKRQQQMAISFADRAGMALANLKLREELRIQSIRDPLTNLFNRRYLEEYLECELARATRKKNSIGVIMLDIDHFKYFNDTFGHDAGDTVLREIGQFLQAHVRKEDAVCRYGGEEFTFIMSEASVDSIRKRAEELQIGVKTLSVRHAGQLLGPVNFSVGVAVFPEHGLTAKDLLKAADAALLCAKTEGRDRTVVGSPAILVSRQPS